jgi:disulfide bond formation protein DsbB
MNLFAQVHIPSNDANLFDFISNGCEKTCCSPLTVSIMVYSLLEFFFLFIVLVLCWFADDDADTYCQPVALLACLSKKV